MFYRLFFTTIFCFLFINIVNAKDYKKYKALDISVGLSFSTQRQHGQNNLGTDSATLSSPFLPNLDIGLDGNLLPGGSYDAFLAKFATDGTKL